MANASSSTSSGQGLHLATLAWAGRHLANQGQEQYETVSEGLASQASGIITARMGEWSTMGGEWWSENECLTLLGGLLMLMQVKVGSDARAACSAQICRGDVWGFDSINAFIRLVSRNLYAANSPGVPDDSLPFCL